MNNGQRNSTQINSDNSNVIKNAEAEIERLKKENDSLKAIQDLAANVMKNSRPMTIEEHEMRNQFIKKEFMTVANKKETQTCPFGCHHTLEEAMATNARLRSERDSFKTIAEEACATVKELENEVVRLNARIDGLPSKEAFDIYQNALIKLCCLGGTRSEGNLIAQETIARARDWVRIKEDASSLPKSVALDRLTKEK